MTSSSGGHAGDMMDRLTGEVLERLRGIPDPRLREVIGALVRHLHAFAREVRLTEQELMTGVAFLTETGRASNDLRQEFILLSDTLGLSSLVNLLDHGSDDPTVTAPTILGPFYVPESPWRELGSSMASPGEPGEPAVLKGQVRSTDGRAVPGAVLDVWQTSANGSYAVQDPAALGAENLRGRYRAAADGTFEIRTVRPVPYSLPDDGPVGRLLRATGRHPMRAAHIHVIVTAKDHRPLTTHVFDAASDYLDSDAVFGVKSSLVRDFVPTAGGEAVCACDFVLDPLSAAVMTAAGRVSDGRALS